ncbi:hypothetical protein L9F63_013301, partial [Diploptera punctata]
LSAYRRLGNNLVKSENANKDIYVFECSQERNKEKIMESWDLQSGGMCAEAKEFAEKSAVKHAVTVSVNEGCRFILATNRKYSGSLPCSLVEMKPLFTIVRQDETSADIRAAHL